MRCTRHVEGSSMPVVQACWLHALTHEYHSYISKSFRLFFIQFVVGQF